MQITPEEIARACALVENGRSVRYAARTSGKPETTVRRAFQRYHVIQRYTRRLDSSRPRPTTARDDIFCTLQCLRDRHQTAVELAQRFRTVRGTTVCAQTTRRRLVEAGLKAKRPNRVPRHTRQHRQQRLEFARIHRNWGHILQDQVVPFATFMGPGFLLMQDNARPHVARCVLRYPKKVEIGRLEWPPMSPDMNPIEHVWDVGKTC